MIHLDLQMVQALHLILRSFEQLDRDLGELIKQGNVHAGSLGLQLNISYHESQTGFVVSMLDDFAVLEEVPADGD